MLIRVRHRIFPRVTSLNVRGEHIVPYRHNLPVGPFTNMEGGLGYPEETSTISVWQTEQQDDVTVSSQSSQQHVLPMDKNMNFYMQDSMTGFTEQGDEI